MLMHQEWLEAKPSDGMDILYTGAHRNLKMNGFNSRHWTVFFASLNMYFWQRIWNHAQINTMLKCFYNATGKRERPYNRWEPIYIGTNEVQPYHNIPSKYDSLDSLYDTLCQEPTYDERLTWEGRSDKMVQVWKMLNQSGEKTINQPIW